MPGKWLQKLSLFLPGQALPAGLRRLVPQLWPKGHSSHSALLWYLGVVLPQACARSRPVREELSCFTGGGW